ncbi:MAG: porphobilinogen synthase [Candidatus Omnitrophica bacterium]|nr:porphobilinogen synthase [Candidatus Omnitrophota bacterium]
MFYPVCRPKRLRQNDKFRRLVRENRVSPDNLIAPFFVLPGKNIKKPINAMPGNFQLSIDNLLREVKQVRDLGIPAIMLFGIPRKKDNLGTEAYAEYGIVQQAIREIKKKVPDILVVTDVCLCEYTSHGHCGIVTKAGKEKGYFNIDNDATLELLANTAISHVQAGADMVGPSAMMDGQVQAIRQGLDEAGYLETPIMAYSAKYASGFYGPFRQAAGSTPQFGDRRSYQMDPANSREAVREVELDIAEGADIVMVKPALAYLDIIAKVKDKFNVPVAAYNVSGEFSMVKAADKAGWIDGQRVAREILTAIKRAGADIIITYHAKEIAGSLK